MTTTKTERFWPVEYNGRAGWQSVGTVFHNQSEADAWVRRIEPAERRERYRVGEPLLCRELHHHAR
jgi:hypothetical protein